MGNSTPRGDRWATERVRAAFQRAASLAVASDEETVRPLHLLLALQDDLESVAGRVLRAAGMRVTVGERLLLDAASPLADPCAVPGPPAWSQELVGVLWGAGRSAPGTVDTGHVLVELARRHPALLIRAGVEPVSVAADVAAGRARAESPG